MGNTLADVVGKLEAMGSADQIALELESLGIRARMSDGNSCAITEYVKQTIETDYVFTSNSFVSALVEGRGDSQELPYAAREFVRRFDAGDFPNLAASDLVVELA